MTDQSTETARVPPIDSSQPGSTSGGIFDGGFEAYRTVTQDEYRILLASGLVVLDANALLNFYRYQTKTRNELLSLLALLGDRLWIPHQAMFEFWENRVGVISDQAQELASAIEDLDKYRRQFEDTIRAWANRIGLSPDRSVEIVDMLGPTVARIKDRIRNLSHDDASGAPHEDTAKDPVVAAIAAILQRNVGLPPSADELTRAKEEAKERYRSERPPGWKDAKKRKNPEGDYLIWRQTLQEAKRRSMDVLFVTGDVKDDWWRRERGEARGPLPELVHEMQTIASVRLFMLRPESFLLHAAAVLEGAGISGDSVKDAQRVSVRGTGEDRRARGLLYSSKVAATIAKMGYLVGDYVDSLEVAFRYHDRVRDSYLDLIVRDNKGRQIYLELKDHDPNKLTRTTLDELWDTSNSSPLPVLLVSSTDLTSAAQVVLREAKNLEAVTWRDEEDDPKLSAALERAFSLHPEFDLP